MGVLLLSYVCYVRIAVYVRIVVYVRIAVCILDAGLQARS
jgi:hypothetical protein